MRQEQRITVWGVRGSAPRPSPECMEYGGNTVCTALEHGNRTVILDAGTGLTPLGRRLSDRTDVRRLDILISHFHIDHVSGLFSFQPLFDPDVEIHLYGGKGLAQHLKALIGPPFWPVGIQDVPARLAFHEIQPGDSFDLDGLAVSTMAGNHPGGSVLYRLDSGKTRLTYAVDFEAAGPALSALAEFAHRSDLLIWDAAFIRSDLRPGWGHSTWEQGLELGCAAEVGRVLMTHYSWDYSDELIRRQETLAGQDGICCFAKEGMVMTL